MITKEQVIELIRERSKEAANLISRMKEQGAENSRHIEIIEALKAVVDASELIIEKMKDEDMSGPEMQSWYNMVLSWNMYPQ